MGIVQLIFLFLRAFIMGWTRTPVISVCDHQP